MGCAAEVEEGVTSHPGLNEVANPFIVIAVALGVLILLFVVWPLVVTVGGPIGGAMLFGLIVCSVASRYSTPSHRCRCISG